MMKEWIQIFNELKFIIISIYKRIVYYDKRMDTVI